ncbi:MAG: DUF2141 domain-containing protein [Chitinophagales bacterium]|nr:DUF2141 domain-containing protein [Bacteroidota bacterium]MCB9044049.1 DUF2141 domain-containing protein [Chitinophagales bacterium]
MLHLKVSGLRNDEATVWVALYNAENKFLSFEDIFRAKKIKPLSGQYFVEMGFDDLPEGEYALTAFQDENENGKLDTNFWGIPVEKYGFYRAYRPIFSAPKFEDCAFYFDNTEDVQIEIILK